MSELRINKILKALKTNTKISGDNMLVFFLGEQNGFTKEVPRNKLKNRKISFTDFGRNNLLESSEWGKERLWQILKEKYNESTFEEEYSTFLKNAREVYKEYTGEEFKDSDVSKLFKQIATLIWFGTPYAETIFDRKSLSDEKYVSWEDKENDLIKVMEKNKLLFVCGTAACGKTRLVEHFINKNVRGEYVLAGIISGEKEPRVQVKYHYGGLKEICMGEFLEQCKWKDSKEYLIINWDYFREEEITPLLNWVSEHEVKVIVITRMRNVPEGHKKIAIEKCSEEVLRKLTKKKIKEKNCGDTYSMFFELLHYNPLLVDVFSMYLSQVKETIYSFCYNAKCEGEVEQLALSRGSKVRCLYRIDPKKNDLLSISAILVRCLSTCSNADIGVLCELIVWIRKPIDKEFVIKMGGFKEETIDDLIEKNYLIYTKENKIQMHPVFVWAIDALEVELTTINSDETSTQFKAKFEEKEILFNENGLQSGINLLDSMKGNSKYPTAYIEYFYQVIENIICRYQRLYSANKNLTDKNKKKYYEQWTEFLEQAVIRLQEMSPSKQAMKVQRKLYIIYKKEKPEVREKTEQSLWKVWATFVYGVMNGHYDNEEIYNICGQLPSCADIKMLYPILDICILKEIFELSLEYTKPVQERNIVQKNPYLQYLLKKYFNKRVFAKGIKRFDDRSDLYAVFYFYYLYAVYREDSLLNKARESVRATYWTTRYARNDEEWMRAQLYFLFFELPIDVETYDLEFLKMKYKYLMADIYERLQLKSYSAHTTSTALITLLIARAWVPVEMIEGKTEELLKQFQSGEYDLFQKLADVNKYQYQIGDEQYQKLIKTIKHSTEEIYKVLRESYTFKEND